MDRHSSRGFVVRRRTPAPANMLLLGLVLVAVVWTGLARDAGATSSGRITFWTRCPLDVRVASVEVGPVEVLHLTCARAKQAIQSARIALTPGGPVFSTTGYTCRSRIILPRFDPSPIELPALESCVDAGHHRLSFIWNFAS
jgi:hypothetical protein